MQHGQFLLQLSYVLIESHLRMRLVNITLSKNLRACTSFMLNTEVPPAQEKTDNLLRNRRYPW